MSRPPPALRRNLSGLLLCCLVLPGAARAQNAESELDRRVAERIGAQKATTDLTDKRCALGNADATEIVVCAPRDRDKDRYPGREQLDSVQSTDIGIPRAPDVSGMPPCLAFCVKMSFGAPPPPMPIIDVKALPEAPPGSDADLIAKGEKAQP